MLGESSFPLPSVNLFSLLYSPSINISGQLCEARISLCISTSRACTTLAHFLHSDYIWGWVAWCHSFIKNWFSFHTYNTFTRSYVHEHSQMLLSISSSLNSSVADTSLACRVGIRTRARLTASRRANWATPHPKYDNDTIIYVIAMNIGKFQVYVYSVQQRVLNNKRGPCCSPLLSLQLIEIHYCTKVLQDVAKMGKLHWWKHQI